VYSDTGDSIWFIVSAVYSNSLPGPVASRVARRHKACRPTSRQREIELVVYLNGVRQVAASSISIWPGLLLVTV